MGCCLSKWTKYRALATLNSGYDVRQKIISFIISGNGKWYSHFGR
jgi:hypothetical protein